MFVARHLHVGDQLSEAPLIYPALLKSALFTAVLACFKILEDAVIGWYRREPFRRSIADSGGGTWHGVSILALLIFVLLIPFVGFGELGSVLGENKLLKLFFRFPPSGKLGRQSLMHP